MILGVFILTIILFIPIFITTYIFYDDSAKRLYFAFYLFGFIRIVSGYVKGRNRGGFYIHISNEKAIIIDTKTIKGLNGGKGITSSFSLFSISYVFDVGLKNLNELIAFYGVYTLTNTILQTKLYNRSHVDFNPNFNVYTDFDDLKAIKLKLGVFFNLFCIVRAIIANSKSSKEVVYER
ncbi:MAG: hypothetical protein IKL82_04360 [Clostridia bacterium]|nr:hypothetical protein [Clostridia bacterium]